MGTGLEFHLLFGVLAYVALFFAGGRLFAGKYLKEKPFEVIKEEATSDVDPNFFMERARDIIRHGERGEEISFILCGFAIISLVFMITVFKESLVLVEIIIALFSLAFVYEVISAFLYHETKTNFYAFGGMVFQYGGLLAMLVGFFSYLSNVMEWSFIIMMIYVVGIIIFIIISIKELTIYAEYSKNIAEEND